MRAWPIAVLVGVVFVAAGPRLVGPKNRAAGAPFAFDPPEGFAEAKDVPKKAEGARAWVHADETGEGARLVLHHTANSMSVDENDLAKLTAEMPKAFEDCTWVHRRHETRTRADGARVGLIEGDCDKEVDLTALGLPASKVKQRKLQLVFPDDDGTSIVTASYPTEQATRWEPVLEDSVGRAKGVATRVPPTPFWQHVAWGGSGLVLGWLAAVLVVRDKEGGKKSSDGDAKRKKREEEDEDGE